MSSPKLAYAQTRATRQVMHGEQCKQCNPVLKSNNQSDCLKFVIVSKCPVCGNRHYYRDSDKSNMLVRCPSNKNVKFEIVEIF